MAVSRQDLSELREQWTAATVALLEAREAEQLAAERAGLFQELHARPGVSEETRAEQQAALEAEKRAAALRVAEAERQLIDCHEAFFGAWRAA